MPVEISPSELAVVPNPELMQGPSTTFPIVIDPTVGRINWSMINDKYPTQSYVMNGYDKDDHMKVGWANTPTGMHYRSMVDFSQSSFAKKHVLKATMESYLLYSWDLQNGQCTATKTNLHSVGAFSSGSTWNNHASSWSGTLAQSPSNENCTGGSIRTEWASDSLTSYVQGRSTANGKVYLGLSGTSDAHWKKFDENKTTLSVVYNSYPNVPTGLTVQSGTATAPKSCITGGSRPSIGLRADGTFQPILKAKVTDPDGGESDLKIKFTWQRDAATDGPGWVAGGTAERANLKSGSIGDFTVPATAKLADGDLVRFNAQALDPWSYGGRSGTDPSSASGWCEFRVDKLLPSAPRVTSLVFPDDGQPHASAGVTADFTFIPAAGDVTGYEWGWSDPPGTYVAGKNVNKALTPPPPQRLDPTDGGPVSLYVRSIDSAGQRSDATSYDFLVGEAAGPVARWRLNDAAGSAKALDATGRGADLVATKVAMGRPGLIRSSALKAAPTVATLPGAPTGFRTASGRAAPTDFATSFSVSAWARPTSVDGYRTVLAADGNEMSMLRLQYRTDTKAWCVYIRAQDADGAAQNGPCSGTSPKVNAWTHLAVVYDRGLPTNQLQLYVDGVLRGAASISYTWKTGSFGVGRAMFEGSDVDNFAGDIADVRVYGRVLTPSEITPMATELAAAYRLDGDGIDLAYGRDAVDHGLVQWSEDRNGTETSAATFRGTNYLTAEAAIRTDQSYTVSAWVYLNDDPPQTGQILGQAGGTRGAFFLRYYGPSNKWEFMLPSTDAGTPTYAAVHSVTGPAFETWVHLAGVYDAPNSQIRFYVNGDLQETQSMTGWASNGPVTIGRYGFGGGDAFRGSLDDVRLYAGAMPATQIATLCNC